MILRYRLLMTMTLHVVCFSSIWHYRNTGWCRDVACLIITGHLLQKSPKISGSFTEEDLHLKASYAPWPPCYTICDYHNNNIETHDCHHVFAFYATICWCTASYAPICSFNAACCSCVMTVLNVAIWCCDMPAFLHAFSNICLCVRERKRENDRKKREGACESSC